jgi:hypothetical protein
MPSQVGVCPRCLHERPLNARFGLSFAPPCPTCGYGFVPFDPERDRRLFVHICPYCGKQERAPGSHHVAGDDHACGCFHAHPGERGLVQPKLVKVEVAWPADFELLEIPHDRHFSEAVPA